MSNCFRLFQAVVQDALVGIVPADLDLSRVAVEPPRDAAHGDMATNAAMVLSKQAKMNPKALAEQLAEKLRQHPDITSVEVAGPGFINWRLSDSFWRAQLSAILKAGTNWGDSDIGKGQKVNVEYVSANPTGPMHIGHARGAVVGDALAALLEKAGYDVAREYYINDAGAQVDVLARSVHLRYREALGETIGPISEGLYPGEYLIGAGQALAKAHGDKWLNAPESEWLTAFRHFAVDAMMDMIRDDLAALGVEHAVFTSERAMVEAGAVDAALKNLEERGLIYTGVLEPPKGKTPEDWEPRPQTLFKATEFGDDVDRPLKKSDGSWTYFASDIAYHKSKFDRGFPVMIDVWGADHGGYVKRLQAAVKAITEGQGALDVKLCQMVSLMKNGEPYKMSKRAGTFVTLRDLIDEVGKDVVRFIMLTRKNDAQLDFDLDKALEQSRDNPVFYVQYAHARACSVARHGAEMFKGRDLSDAALSGVDLSGLQDADEMALIRLMAAWPRLVESAAESHEPHRVAYYLADLAAAFHGLWNRGRDEAQLRFLIGENPDLSLARLALVRGVALVAASGLKVFGVEPVLEMR
ncbi:Arginine--tRNA ligase [Rhodospirillaceae bacterium LM-1]|nr:Arginine--tRNA ligase [Rhodospirillaceae bacterium LM-1]